MKERPFLKCLLHLKNGILWKFNIETGVLLHRKEVKQTEPMESVAVDHNYNDVSNCAIDQHDHLSNTARLSDTELVNEIDLTTNDDWDPQESVERTGYNTDYMDTKIGESGNNMHSSGGFAVVLSNGNGIEGTVFDEFDVEVSTDVTLQEPLECTEMEVDIVIAHIDCDSIGWFCMMCGRRYGHEKSVVAHLERIHFPHVQSVKVCSVCNVKLTDRQHSYHMFAGHIDLTDKMVVVSMDEELQLVKFHEELRDVGRPIQVVIIPWVNDNDESVQISVGVTRFGNVENYAKRIWTAVRNALKKKRLRVMGCGSAVNCSFYHDIVMNPAAAFSTGLISFNIYAANKMKGYLRDGLDTIRRAAANDIFDYLNPIESFVVEKIKIAMDNGLIPKHNMNYFLETVDGKVPEASLYNRRKFNIHSIKNVLDSLSVQSDGYDGCEVVDDNETDIY